MVTLGTACEPRTPLIEWGVASFLPAGRVESGDQHLVKLLGNGALVAAVDGIGHGSEAAALARIAVATLERHAGEDVVNLVRRCHNRLTGTRGVVISLASFDGLQNEMTWLAIGNVESFLLRRDPNMVPPYRAIILRSGIVGHKLPPLQAAVLPVSCGDLLIQVTDGIRSDFISDMDPRIGEDPQRIAEKICASNVKGDDDGLVLVARYIGWHV